MVKDEPLFYQQAMTASEKIAASVFPTLEKNTQLAIADAIKAVLLTEETGKKYPDRFPGQVQTVEAIGKPYLKHEIMTLTGLSDPVEADAYVEKIMAEIHKIVNQTPTTSPLEAVARARVISPTRIKTTTKRTR